jgi:hypothetical protein
LPLPFLKIKGNPHGRETITCKTTLPKSRV